MVDGNEAYGKLLVSDADGIMAWTDPGTITTAPDGDSDPTNEKSDLDLASDVLTLSNPATGGNQAHCSRGSCCPVPRATPDRA